MNGPTYDRLDAAGVRHQLLDLGQRPVQRLLGDVGHEHVGALLGEEDARLETDASVSCERECDGRSSLVSMIYVVLVWRSRRRGMEGEEEEEGQEDDE